MNLHVKPVTLHVHDPDIVCLLLLHRVLLVIKVLRRVDTGDDIEDPSHYSVEDAKQKAEHDRKLKVAEAKKQKVSTANTCTCNNNSLMKYM